MTASIARALPEKQERPPYRLKKEPDGRAWTARENLADILDRELLGPANGPDELLNGPPDAAYLVGRIAPAKLRAGDADPTDADDPDGATDVGDAVDAEESRGVPVASGGDGAGDEGGGDGGGDDEGADDRPQQRGLMIPASMGLRLQIPDDLAAFTVVASWGTYRAVRDEGEDARRSRRYQRTPVSVTTTVTVADLQPGATKTYVLQDKVVLRVDRYDDAARGCRLIEVALCNDRVTPRRIPVDAWLYQTRLNVDAGGAAVFLPVADALVDDVEEPDDELRRLRLQYRDRLEFAVGRTCSVEWDVAPGERRATAVRTTWLPVCETPQTTAEEVDGALLDMQELAKADRSALDAGLRPIVEGYRRWLDGEQQSSATLPAHLRPDAEEAIDEARRVADQLADGLAHLLDESEVEALRCFRFMNHVMAEQRIQSQVAEYRAARPTGSIADARDAVLAERGVRAHSWRTFQLAFILTQLPLLSDPAAPRRSGELARAQLLFFPTGGGKTEAYLGLAAYTFAVRRRQGVLNTVDGPLDGRDGVAVLMRYTLRLLTAQQFQRATALVCAAELARRADPAVWGDESFRIGLWVGTDVSPKWWDEADDQLKNVHDGRRHRLTVLQIQRCPWCGSRIDPRDVTAVKSTRRVLVRCSDDRGGCPFAAGSEVTEGLPVLTVDEEIYRLAPAFVIATVDKFARLAREGAAASLFGYVARRCARHGYVHPDYRFCDLKEGGKHQATKDGLPPAGVYPVTRLRPPDLVIQDELHLITGALGTTVGLFEVAVDVLTAWRDPVGRPVRPLLVASTATARNAPDQVKALYGRGVTIFPPQVLDAGRTFFSRDEPVSEAFPGRRYIGISTTGVRLTTAEIRVAEILMAGAQELLDRDGPTGSAADPYLTLVGYFSAMRELAGMARYLSDDVQTALRNGRRWSALPRRRGTTFRQLHVAELTSRVASADITGTLDQMALGFDPRFDTDAGRRALVAEREAGRPVPRRDTAPFDAVLATSMLQVGVDVTRLGLMLVVGQPKNTAEYIQASSRVGRDPSRPGLVVSLGNWARPRDLAHFEQFRHYHETFYRQVEALSVTPYSPTSIDRGLDGVLVSATRVREAAVPNGLSPERAAGRIEQERAAVVAVIEVLVARAARSTDEDGTEQVRRALVNRLDQWVKRRSVLAEKAQQLVYERGPDDKQYGPLMNSPENARALPDQRDAPPFVVANSMREVQPEINLLVSPIEENLVYVAPFTAPTWQMPGATPVTGVEERYSAASAIPVDPLGDAEELAEKGRKRNRAKVGSSRPSTLLYTYGPGAVMDLPQFTIMPTGLDDWDRIWRRRDGTPEIHAPRLRAVVRLLLRSRDVQLRPHPWQPKRNVHSKEGDDLGVPARVFPQWLRCTGCNMLARLDKFDYRNTAPYRPDLAEFDHERCPGTGRGKALRQPAVPARYLLACVDGHLDEFPYDLWVHRGQDCASAEFPALRMTDRTSGKGASAVIECASCGLKRPMNEAQGEAANTKLPTCRGRHPHLDAFEPDGCGNDVRLMLIGASNLWFPATQSVIVMPESDAERKDDRADRIRIALGANLAAFRDQLPVLRALLMTAGVDDVPPDDGAFAELLTIAEQPPADPVEQEQQVRDWDPVDLLVPEWNYLKDDPLGPHQEDPVSGLTLTKQERGARLLATITRVLAVERLRKVNALVGFTRIDDMDRVGDLARRLVPLTRARYPKWTVATEDRGEGIFLQLDEARVAAWEQRVEPGVVWQAHRAAHRLNFERRFSDTAKEVDPDTRLPPPRYWLVHTLAHVLIRELAMSCGYSAASLSERLYAWRPAPGRPAAAGLLICTTASDSDGTLGGLVQQSEADRLAEVVVAALRRATRCSSDPICAGRTPQDPEDFLHGAACHCCVMASETSCERANRFLDRRFLIDLPGSDVGFFDLPA